MTFSTKFKLNSRDIFVDDTTQQALNYAHIKVVVGSQSLILQFCQTVIYPWKLEVVVTPNVTKLK